MDKLALNMPHDHKRDRKNTMVGKIVKILSKIVVHVVCVSKFVVNSIIV